MITHNTRCCALSMEAAKHIRCFWCAADTSSTMQFSGCARMYRPAATWYAICTADAGLCVEHIAVCTKLFYVLMLCGYVLRHSPRSQSQSTLLAST
mmetsp:Transcript_36492/g.72678  ORF Transcript_36492/g.72678 Transcript_36492/m.72678 type:complete len:96 (+) Transcript_36492:81-368(+)